MGRSEADTKNELEKTESTQKRPHDPLNNSLFMIFEWQADKKKTSDRHLDAERTSIFVSDQTAGVVSCFTGLY